MISGADERLPVLNISNQYMNNTKLSNLLITKLSRAVQEEKINSSHLEFDFRIKENVVNLLNIDTDENIKLSDTNITFFDMTVMDAVYTITQQGGDVVTPEWIVCVMSGTRQYNHITQKKVNAVMNSIEKLQYIRIKVDCTQEYNKYQIQKKQNPVEYLGYESYLMPVGKIEAKYDANGKRVTAYKILEKPAMYRYAEMNRQIVDVPAELLETQGMFSDTEEAVLIKRYVIKRVAQIVNRNSLHNNKVSFIWYDNKEKEERGLFPELGYKPDGTKGWRKKKQRINEIVKGTLDCLVDKNAITGYEEYREDGTKNPASPIAGYRIFYDRDQSVLPVGSVKKPPK